MIRKIFFIFIFALGLVFPSRDVFGYEDKTTHPALTNEAIDFYNLNFSQKITSEEKEWLISGSILEDTPPRWINHFYDPIYKTGWTGEAGFITQDLLQKFSDVFLSNESAVPTLNWAHNQELQAKYKLYQGNQTWEKAIYEYVKNKNKKEAYYALGHILHLLEDMAVPDHTRNDTHTGDSPYENYANQFNRDNFHIIGDLQKQNYKPVILNSLNDYFEYLADYSNNYFFSKDTINDPKYNKPKIINESGNYAYSLDKTQEKFEVALTSVSFIKDGDNFIQVKNYIIEDKPTSIPILNSYFTRLAREAVLAGSGVINLFFQEAERAEKDPGLLQKPPEEKSAIVSIAGEVFKIIGALDSIKNSIINALSASIENVFISQDSEIISTSQVEIIGAASSVPVPQAVQPAPPPAKPTTISYVPPLPSLSLPPPFPAPNPPPLPVSLSSSSPTSASNNFIASLPYPGFGGGGSPAPAVPSSQQSDGEPSSSPPPATTTPADTTPPDVFFSILECENSFSPSGCLFVPQIYPGQATTTLHLIWQSSAEDLDCFELTIKGSISTTTATSTIVNVSNNAAYQFFIRAKDTNDNWSEPQQQIVEISTMPVVINEVAWSGAFGHPQDEWIELYNRTSKNINLNNWVLYSQTDNSPYINLSGAIPAKGYHLIERKTESKIFPVILGNNNNPLTDIFVSFSYGLNNGGEILILSYASTTIDQTAVNLAGRWPGGIDASRTMERCNPDLSGSDLLNWGTNNMLIKNGKNAASQFWPINGTPKARNSCNYLIAGNGPVYSDLTLTKSKSPYLVDNAVIVVEPGVNLTIEPGVVVKFYNDAGMTVLGKIISRGTENKPIVFTSFEDDEHGGDLNGDATSTNPAPGSWLGVNVSSNGSIFDRAIFRYGGKWYNGVGNHMADLSIKDSSAIISNSVFEYSRVYGLNLINSDSTIANNIFRNNNKDNDPSGYNSAMLAIGGSPSVKNNQFIGNARGLYFESSISVADSNFFESNSAEALYSSGMLGSFTNNSGSSNGRNAISIRGDLTKPDSSANLKVNPLPYSLEAGASVVASSTLTIEKGVVIKSAGNGFSVSGNLVIDGENPEDVIFTSLYDDSISGDTTNNGTATPAGPGSFPGITIYKGGRLEGRGFTMRYAGSNSWGGNNSAAIVVNGARACISNALFSDNYPYGIYAVDKSAVEIENARFENHNYSGPWGGGAALAVFDSSASLSGVSFINNFLGVLSDTISSFAASAVDFVANNATTSPSGLWQ